MVFCVLGTIYLTHEQHFVSGHKQVARMTHSVEWCATFYNSSWNRQTDKHEAACNAAGVYVDFGAG